MSSFLPGHVGAGITDRLEHILQQDAAPRRPLTWEQREALIPVFESDIAVLESVTGEEFGDWLHPRGECPAGSWAPGPAVSARRATGGQEEY